MLIRTFETKACLSQSQLKGHSSHERHFVLNTEERISIRLSSPHKGVCVKMQSGAPLEKKKAVFECLIPRAADLSARSQMRFNCSNIYEVFIKDVFTGIRIQTQTCKQVPQEYSTKPAWTTASVGVFRRGLQSQTTIMFHILHLHFHFDFVHAFNLNGWVDDLSAFNFTF